MYSITIYGSNTLVSPDSNSECTLTTITALSDVVTKTFDCYGAYQSISPEGEEIIGVGKVLGYQRADRDSYDIPLIEVSVSSYATFLTDIKAVLTKKYHYITFSGLPYNVQSTGKAKCVSAVTLSDPEQSGAYKRFNLTCKNRVLNG